MKSKTRSTIPVLLEQATEHYEALSKLHKKLLKYGYNKPFSVFMEEMKARVAYRKVFSKKN